MNEHNNEPRDEARAQEMAVLKTARPHGRPAKGDLVVDLSRISELNLANLTVLLTAQQQARKEDRAVWLVGVPMNVWRALDSMGLGKFFKAFPVSQELAV